MINNISECMWGSSSKIFIVVPLVSAVSMVLEFSTLSGNFGWPVNYIDFTTPSIDVLKIRNGAVTDGASVCTKYFIDITLAIVAVAL